MLLEDITQINIGIVLKRKQAIYKNNNTFKYKIFNLKSYEEKKEYEVFYSEENLGNYIAKKGDLLFRLAFPLKIIEVDDEIEGLLINNQYCIIKMLDHKNVSYQISFIKWFLESDNTKYQLEKYLIGSVIKTIPVVKLRKLPIPEIHKSDETILAKIIDDWDRQKSLYNKIIKEKEKYYNSIINKVISGGKINE